jgi:CobQ-like glutamine amidotransferase family enzyme
LRIGNRLHEMADAGTPMLVICGSYQLFGHRYVTHNKDEVKGIGIFDAETIGGDKRMIGNVMVKSDFGLLFGFENHSGQTFLGSNQSPFGKVLRGGGNNGSDKTEGARTNNVFGSYLHGPLLPNNPQFCDELILLAAKKRYGDFKLREVDDSVSIKAREQARHRSY